MFGQKRNIFVPLTMEKFSRAFNIGEEESDSASGQFLGQVIGLPVHYNFTSYRPITFLRWLYQMTPGF